MKSATFLVIFSLFIMGIYAASTGGDLPLASETTNMPVAVDDKPDTSSTTTAETTEASKSKNTTTQASTTTEAPTPTTASTTTVAPTTPTPTSSTSTPAPIPTTPAPKPEEPKSGKYYVEEGGVKCILVEFAAQLNISYGNDKYVIHNLPSNSDQFQKADGKCGNETTEQSLEILWWADNKDVNTLSLTFSLNKTSKPNEYSLTKAFFNLSSTVIPDNRTERVYLYHVGDFFETRAAHSYHCGRAQTLNLTETVDPKSKLLGNVTLSHVFMEAYRSKSDENFAESIDCDAINTPDIVPIAVGIALIALVVVVLIAYLVGRRRAQSRGYVSM